jgi:uncharacterized protein YqfA (UPF0365 family)
MKVELRALKGELSETKSAELKEQVAAAAATLTDAKVREAMDRLSRKLESGELQRQLAAAKVKVDLAQMRLGAEEMAKMKEQLAAASAALTNAKVREAMETARGALQSEDVKRQLDQALRELNEDGPAPQPRENVK